VQATIPQYDRAPDLDMLAGQVDGSPSEPSRASGYADRRQDAAGLSDRFAGSLNQAGVVLL
jgi:hypothetical protein